MWKCALFSGDNLASHYIHVGGFKSPSGALHKCRICMGTDEDMKTKVSWISIALPRDKYYKYSSFWLGNFKDEPQKRIHNIVNHYLVPFAITIKLHNMVSCLILF